MNKKVIALVAAAIGGIFLLSSFTSAATNPATNPDPVNHPNAAQDKNGVWVDAAAKVYYNATSKTWETIPDTMAYDVPAPDKLLPYTPVKPFRTMRSYTTVARKEVIADDGTITEQTQPYSFKFNALIYISGFNITKQLYYILSQGYTVTIPPSYVQIWNSVSNSTTNGGSTNPFITPTGPPVFSSEIPIEDHTVMVPNTTPQILSVLLTPQSFTTTQHTLLLPYDHSQPKEVADGTVLSITAIVKACLNDATRGLGARWMPGKEVMYMDKKYFVEALYFGN